MRPLPFSFFAYCCFVYVSGSVCLVLYRGRRARQRTDFFPPFARVISSLSFISFFFHLSLFFFSSFFASTSLISLSSFHSSLIFPPLPLRSPTLFLSYPVVVHTPPPSFFFFEFHSYIYFALLLSSLLVSFFYSFLTATSLPHIPTSTLTSSLSRPLPEPQQQQTPFQECSRV